MPAEAVRAVVQDLVLAFPGLDPSGVGDLLDRQGLPTSLIPDSDASERWAVSWEARFTFNAQVPALMGVAPTGQELHLRGITVVTAADNTSGDPIPLGTARDEQLLFHRFIDWMYVFAQLGIVVAPRPIRSPVAVNSG